MEQNKIKLTAYNLDRKLLNKLTKPLDPNVIKTRKSGSETLSYIAGNTCTDLLNNAFSYAWDFEILWKDIVKAKPQLIKQTGGYNGQPYKWPKGIVPPADVEIKDYYKGGKCFVFDEEAYIAWVQVRLTVKLVDENGKEHYVYKDAFGSQLITGNPQSQSMNGFKGAQTDALKKAATLLNIGLELYRDENEQLFYDSLDEEKNETINKVAEALEEKGWGDEELAYFIPREVNTLNELDIDELNEMLKQIVEYEYEEETDEEGSEQSEEQTVSDVDNEPVEEFDKESHKQLKKSK